MSEATRASVVRWPVPVALAVPALAAAALIAFTPGHSIAFGALVFAGFALLTAVAAVLGAATLPRGGARSAAIAKSIIAALGAVAGLVLGLVGLADVPAAPVLDAGAVAAADNALGLSLTVALTLAALAVVDLVVGIRLRRTDRYGRDWITTGVIEALGAAAVLAVPPTFLQAFSFTDKGGELVSGAVTSSTMVVGLFGAIAAILGVFLAIVGIGLLPQRERATA